MEKHGRSDVKVPRWSADLLPMSMFAWKDNFNIGVAEIDAQHRRLYSLADELYAAMFTGKGKEVMEPVLRNLVDYTKTHFAAEERLMQKCVFPDYQAHKMQHIEMTNKVLQLQRDFQAGKNMITIEVMEFLSNWLRHHIAGSDRKYVPFVKGKAVA